MTKQTELKDFYDITKINAFCQDGTVTANQLVNLFKKNASERTPMQRHQIRKKILTRMISKGFVCETIDLKGQFNRQKDKLHDQYSSVFLLSCGEQNYHRHSIEDLVDQIINTKEIICKQCEAKGISKKCINTSDITPDALFMSYYNQTRHFKDYTLKLSKRIIEQQNEKERKQVEAGQWQMKTVVTLKQGKSIQISIIQLHILQIVDCSLVFNRAVLSDKIIDFINNPLDKQLASLLNTNLTPIMINCICFQTLVRIRNPIIHRDCKPTDHENKLILYSFEQVYCRLFTPGSSCKIRCSYPPCQNYFNRENFEQKSIFAESIRSVMYEESMENLFGLLFGYKHQVNWHRQWEESILIKDNNKGIVERYRSQIQTLVKNLVTPVNLMTSEKNKNKLKKWLSKTLNNNQKTSNLFEKVDLFGKEEQIIRVKLNQFNICPVRCIFCKNLNALNAYHVAFYFLKDINPKCPLCQHEVGRCFTDSFYLDVQLMKFLFFQGQAEELYYNVFQKTYFHRLSYFSGISLRDKLKRINKIKTYHNIYQLAMNLQLDPKKVFIPFIDQRCIQIINEKPHEANSHYIYIQSQKSINQNIKCSLCLKTVRVDTLYYNEQMEYILKKSGNNKLCWLENSQLGQFMKRMAILQIKYYSDIKKEYKIVESGPLKFYWKNYQGTLIQYPFKFKGCNHSLTTAVCDFKDLLYQIKIEKRTSFQCRDNRCQHVYEYAQDLEIVPLDIFDKLSLNQNLMRQVLIQNKYWITYNLQNNTIQDVSQQFSQRANINEQNRKVQKFRHKPRFLQSKEQRIKQINQLIKKTNQDSQSLSLQIIQDEEMSVKCSEYSRSQNESKLKDMKMDLAIKRNNKSELLAQKEELTLKVKEESRSKNDTNYLNFSRLSKAFPTHCKRLSEKQAKNPYNQEEIIVNQFSTYGNVFIFKYPVNKTQSNAIPCSSFWSSSSFGDFHKS